MKCPGLLIRGCPPRLIFQARRLEMTEIFSGRYTARTDKPLALFLIGMWLNKLWAAHKGRVSKVERKEFRSAVYRRPGMFSTVVFKTIILAFAG